MSDHFGARDPDETASLAANLDAVSRDIHDLEAVVASAMEDTPQDHERVERLASTPRGLTYAELTSLHEERRAAGGWGEADLQALLDPTGRALIEQWRSSERQPWAPGDLAAVAVAGLFGALAAIFDEALDGSTLAGLSWLKQTDVLQRWEQESARLAIDYTGPHFGGPAHRMRSAGHDIGRLFSGLQQVRDGVFRGVRWEDGVRILEEVSTLPSGRPFTSGRDSVETLALLMKHLAADVVTPMSLPLPGWSRLYEMPDRDLRKFAHDAYSGAVPGEGLNLRSGLVTPALSMFVTEVIIRTHTHISAYSADGSPALTAAARSKQSEMLLAAHGAAGAACLSKAAATTIAGDPLGFRHLNVPVLLRTGALALRVRRDHQARHDGSEPTWHSLWAQGSDNWRLDEALALADILDREAV